MTAGQPAAADVRLLAFVGGHVQGVGFRWWTRCRARELGLVGHAKNLPDGRVEVDAQGPREACERLLDLLGRPVELRRPGAVTGVTHDWLPPVTAPQGFVER